MANETKNPIEALLTSELGDSRKAELVKELIARDLQSPDSYVMGRLAELIDEAGKSPAPAPSKWAAEPEIEAEASEPTLPKLAHSELNYSDKVRLALITAKANCKVDKLSVSEMAMMLPGADEEKLTRTVKRLVTNAELSKRPTNDQGERPYAFTNAMFAKNAQGKLWQVDDAEAEGKADDAEGKADDAEAAEAKADAGKKTTKSKGNKRTKRKKAGTPSRPDQIKGVLKRAKNPQSMADIIEKLGEEPDNARYYQSAIIGMTKRGVVTRKEIDGVWHYKLAK